MVDKLSKQYCLDWLNYRLGLAPNGGVSQFNKFDVDFIRAYIHYRKDTEVPPELVVASIQRYPIQMLWGYFLDPMMNWVITHFSIDIESERFGVGEMKVTGYK